MAVKKMTPEEEKDVYRDIVYAVKREFAEMGAHTGDETLAEIKRRWAVAKLETPEPPPEPQTPVSETTRVPSTKANQPSKK